MIRFTLKPTFFSPVVRVKRTCIFLSFRLRSGTECFCVNELPNQTFIDLTLTGTNFFVFDYLVIGCTGAKQNMIYSLTNITIIFLRISELLSENRPTTSSAVVATSGMDVVATSAPGKDFACPLCFSLFLTYALLYTAPLPTIW